MKIKFKFICFILVVIFSAILSTGQESTTVLVWEDYEWLREKNSNGPQLSSAPDELIQWESYEQWHCFDVGEIEIGCSIYGDDIQVPSITAMLNSRSYFFDLPVDVHYSCEKINNQWKELVVSTQQICIMAAEQPGVFEDNSQSLWSVNAIKTENGYWALGDI